MLNNVNYHGACSTLKPALMCHNPNKCGQQSTRSGIVEFIRRLASIWEDDWVENIPFGF